MKICDVCGSFHHKWVLSLCFHQFVSFWAAWCLSLLYDFCELSTMSPMWSQFVVRTPDEVFLNEVFLIKIWDVLDLTPQKSMRLITHERSGFRETQLSAKVFGLTLGGVWFMLFGVRLHKQRLDNNITSVKPDDNLICEIRSDRLNLSLDSLLWKRIPIFSWLGWETNTNGIWVWSVLCHILKMFCSSESSQVEGLLKRIFLSDIACCCFQCSHSFQ